MEAPAHVSALALKRAVLILLPRYLYFSFINKYLLTVFRNPQFWSKFFSVFLYIWFVRGRFFICYCEYSSWISRANEEAININSDIQTFPDNSSRSGWSLFKFKDTVCLNHCHFTKPRNPPYPTPLKLFDKNGIPQKFRYVLRQGLPLTGEGLPINRSQVRRLSNSIAN